MSCGVAAPAVLRMLRACHCIKRSTCDLGVQAGHSAAQRSTHHRAIEEGVKLLSSAARQGAAPLESCGPCSAAHLACMHAPALWRWRWMQCTSSVRASACAHWCLSHLPVVAHGPDMPCTAAVQAGERGRAGHRHRRKRGPWHVRAGAHPPATCAHACAGAALQAALPAQRSGLGDAGGAAKCRTGAGAMLRPLQAPHDHDVPPCWRECDGGVVHHQPLCCPWGGPAQPSPARLAPAHPPSEVATEA